MSMSRKDFEAIAQAVSETRCQLLRDECNKEVRNSIAATCKDLIHALADVCARHNPEFQRSKFIDACLKQP